MADVKDQILWALLDKKTQRRQPEHIRSHDEVYTAEQIDSMLGSFPFMDANFEFRPTAVSIDAYRRLAALERALRPTRDRLGIEAEIMAEVDAILTAIGPLENPKGEG